MSQNLEPGEIVMCTVEKIVGTTVFVKIGNNSDGSIILSEIAPGRIRNLRDYVVPKKKIICKVLRISNNNVELSLRRVTQKEQKELKEKSKLEKSYTSILETVLGEKSKSVIEEIKKTHDLCEFLDAAKTNPEMLKQFLEKDATEKILKILKTQKQKTFFSKKEFYLTSTKGDGIEKIKEILKKIKIPTIKYISAGRYLIEVQDTDPKKAELLLKDSLKEIEICAKNESLNFSIKEK